MNPKLISYQTKANTILTNLTKRNMEGFYFEEHASAVAKVMELLSDNATVSWGGSSTLKEIGLLDALRETDLSLIDRDTALTSEEKTDIFRQSIASDYFLMSSNAITLNGELVNIDGNGNRIACLIHGPKHVIILVGMNKVVADVDSGIKRVRNIAAPPNATRLNMSTPCAQTGRCGDCLLPDCFCCQITVTRMSKHPDRIKVILIGEDVGY